MSRADVAAWETYVRGQMQAFYAHCDGVTYIWAHTPAADKLVQRLGGDSELAAFTGLWHVARKHVTTEFRQWVEEHDVTARLTFSEWRAAAVAERAEVAYMESAAYAINQLDMLRRLTLERDAMIRDAAAKGAAKTDIARAIGISRQQVHTIIAAGEQLAPVTPIRPDVADVDPVTEYAQLASGEWVEVF